MYYVKYISEFCVFSFITYVGFPAGYDNYYDCHQIMYDV